MNFFQLTARRHGQASIALPSNKGFKHLGRQHIDLWQALNEAQDADAASRRRWRTRQGSATT